MRDQIIAAQTDALYRVGCIDRSIRDLEKQKEQLLADVESRRAVLMAFPPPQLLEETAHAAVPVPAPAVDPVADVPAPARRKRKR